MFTMCIHALCYEVAEAVFAFVFSLSFVTFWAIKRTIGLRVAPEAEDAGLDIVEHGMYGYPEAFIPAPEIGADSHGPAVPQRNGAVAAPTSAGAREVTA